MKIKDDLNILVLMGGWNKHIFTPPWVNKFLLPDEKLKVEFPLNIDGSLRITGDKIRISIVGNKLNLVAVNSSDEVFDIIQEVSLKIVDCLPHTPVSAFGINFLFEAETNKMLEDFQKLNDIDSYSTINGEIQKTQIRRTVKFENKLLNLTIDFEEKSSNFNFNYHYNIISISAFKEIITNSSILSHKLHALDVLKNVFEIENE